MKKAILKRFSAKAPKKEVDRNMVVSGREMFINKQPRVEIELRRIHKAK